MRTKTHCGVFLCPEGKEMSKANLKTTRRGEKVELDEMNVILRITKEAVSLELNAGILDEAGKLRKVGKRLSVSEIREARQAFLDNVEGDDYDARFVITEEGRRYLESLRSSEGGRS